MNSLWEVFTRRTAIFILLLFSYTTIAVNQENHHSFSGRNYQFNQVDLRPNIPGKPGIDYPIYYAVPITNFKCDNRHEGYYADVETRCQVFRICANTDIIGNGFGFLCPNGTIFSQKKFVCDWYRNVDCNESEDFYYMNKALGKFIKNKEEMMKVVEEMIAFPMKSVLQKFNSNNYLTSTISPTKINTNHHQHHHHPSHSDNDEKYRQNISNTNQNYATTKSFLQNQKKVTNHYDANKIIKLIPNNNNELFNKNNNKQKNFNDNQSQITTPTTTTSSISSISGIERRPTTIIPITKDESETALKDLEKFLPPGKVYISNLGELSTDIGSAFDPKTSKIISESYESKTNYHTSPSSSSSLFPLSDGINAQTKSTKKPIQSKKLTNLSRRINSYLESLDQYSEELNADQSIPESKYLVSTKQQQQQSKSLHKIPSTLNRQNFIRSNFASNINNAFTEYNSPLTIDQHSNQNQQYTKISSIKPSNYHQSNSHQNHHNLADNVNTVFQSRMDEGSQELVSTAKEYEPLYVGHGNLAGFVNAAVQSGNSEFRTGRQFQFQGSGFAKDRKQLSSSTSGRSIGRANGNGATNSRTYLPPQKFILPEFPDISTFASGFKLNNQDSFSMTIPRNILDLPKLLVDETEESTNVKVDKKSNQPEKTTDEIDKTDKLNKANSNKSNKPKPNRVTKIVKLARKKPTNTTKSALFQESDVKVKEKADNLLLQGVHQALYENNTKIPISNSLLESDSETQQEPLDAITTTSTTSAIVTSTTIATPSSTNKSLIDFLTPTPIPVIELTHTQFPNSLIFSNTLTKSSTPASGTTKTPRRVTQRSSRTSSTRQTTVSSRVANNRGTAARVTSRAVISTTPSNFFYTVKSSNNGSKKVHSIHFGSEYSTRSTTVPTTRTTITARSTTRGRQSIRQSSKTTASTTPTTTIEPQVSYESDEKTLTDLTPLANSYGFNRNSFNRINNDTKPIRQRRPKINNSSSSRNSNSNSSTSSFSSSISHRTRNSFSLTSNSSIASSRQLYKQNLSNNSKNDTKLQQTSNVRNRGYKNKNLDTNTKSNRTQISQDHEIKKAPVYVELPGTKVQIAKSEEQGHFLISNDPSLANNQGYSKEIFRRPNGVKSSTTNIQQNPYYVLDQYIQSQQQQNNFGTVSQPTTTNFFLPFPTISPSRSPTYRPTEQPRTHHHQFNNNRNQQYPNYQFQSQLGTTIQSSTEKSTFSIQPSLDFNYQSGLSDTNFNGFSQNHNNDYFGAQRRLDVVENSEKEKSLYSGVSSYNVPLKSVGRLPADIVGTKKI